MTMIERVARAICIGMGDDPDREGERLTAYDTAARAAIEAMMEPSEDMLHGGSVAADETANGACLIWQAMLTTALNEDGE